MLFLIFPKEFEFELFVYSIGDNLKYFNCYDFKFNCFVLGIYNDDDVVYMLACFIEESDIGFNNIFRERIGEMKKYIPLNEHTIVLCGTCGGSANDDNNEIGECFQIIKAYKYDRGTIEKISANTFKLNINNDDVLEENSRMFKYSDVSTTYCLSSNYVINCNVKEFIKESCTDLYNIVKDKHVVAEMETYDFFHICNKNNIDRYYCIRIISDLPDGQDFEFINEQLNNFDMNMVLKKKKDIFNNRIYFFTQIGEKIFRYDKFS